MSQRCRTSFGLRSLLLSALLASLGGCGGGSSSGNAGGGGSSGGPAPPPPDVALPFPILFVTQVPIPSDLRTVTSAFANHLTGPEHCPPGGSLMLYAPDGTLRDLTYEAGLGVNGFQGAQAIAVREPCVHWDADRALFSMLLGAPTNANDAGPWFWQIHEVTGLGPGQTAAIQRVANQPADANNLSPVYGSDDAILFTSDRPLGGAAHLYPQLDEYELAETTTGIWKLDPQSGLLSHLEDSPSGAFRPVIDSFGRIVFTRWDHLERDQQADAYRMGLMEEEPVDFSSEAATAALMPTAVEDFPEPRTQWLDWVESHPGFTGDLAGYAPHLVGHTFNSFTPWELNQDGTAEETLIHVGRHELHASVRRVRNDDPALVDHTLGAGGPILNSNPIVNFFQGREDPSEPGSFFGVDAPRLRSHTAGQLVKLRRAVPAGSPDQCLIEYLTPRDTFGLVATPEHTGRYRNPLPIADGRLLAVHSPYPGPDANVGTATNPVSLHAFRFVELEASGPYLRPKRKLTAGIAKTVQYFADQQLVTWSGELWELDPVEVAPRPRPASSTGPPLSAPEAQVFADEGVDVAAFQAWLASNGLALIVSRDVTTRDANDLQQPFNLRVPGGTASISAPQEHVYDIEHLQLFQADRLRSLRFTDGTLLDGRRVLARPLHDAAALAANPPAAGAPPGSVAIAPDGSVAAVVPAGRAVSWQTVAPDGEAIVRERYWLSFRPGEVRVCTSCHAPNALTQVGLDPPVQAPEALRSLLQYLQSSGTLP